jgi:hypothetical protein
VLGSSCRCAAQQPPATPAIAAALPRRALLAAAAAVAALTPVRSALAFGSGFPGYDINMDARKRAADRNKRENEAMMAKGELPTSTRHSCTGAVGRVRSAALRAQFPPLIPLRFMTPPPAAQTGSSTCSRAISCKAGSRQGSSDGCGPIHRGRRAQGSGSSTAGAGPVEGPGRRVARAPIYLPWSPAAVRLVCHSPLAPVKTAQQQQAAGPLRQIACVPPPCTAHI